MSKRGSAELFILIAIIVIAAVGLFIVLGKEPTGKFSAIPPQEVQYPYSPLYGYQYPGAESPITSCERACRNFYSGDEGCLARCQQFSSTGDPYAWQPTGKFAIPAAKEYGGAVRGIAAPGTRAFPAGRAYELPEQSCYTCSCLEQGITATSKESAQHVCTDNCGGEIVYEVTGPCQ